MMKFNVSKQFFMLSFLLSAFFFSCNNESDSITPQISEEKSSVFGYTIETTGPIVSENHGRIDSKVANPIQGLYAPNCVESGEAFVIQLIVPNNVFQPGGYYTVEGGALLADGTYHGDIFSYDDTGHFVHYTSSRLNVTLPYRDNGEEWEIEMIYRGVDGASFADKIYLFADSFICN